MSTVRLLSCVVLLMGTLPWSPARAGEPAPAAPEIHAHHPIDLPPGAEEPEEESPFERPAPGRRPAGSPAATFARSAVSGAPYIPVILTDFSDNPAEESIHPPSAYHSLLFEKDYAGGAGSLRDYYLEESGGQLDVTGVVTPWLRMPRTYSSYVGSSYGYQLSTPNDWTLVQEAVAAADAYVDFCSADSNVDGLVDTVFVVHAGAGAEETGSGLWSVKWSLPSPFTTADKCGDGRTMKVSTFTIQPEEYASTRYSAPATPDRLIGVGLFVHEFGHVLGLPDLYDTDYSSPGGVGPWDVMASGSWGFWGNRPWRPTPLSAWSKLQLGWATATNVTENMDAVALPSTDASHTGTLEGIYRLAPGGSATASEYFLVENRTKEGWAADFPTGGLAVWHVHDGRPGNSDDAHRLVELVQADGLDHLSSTGRGDAGDLFPGTSQVTSIGGTGLPSLALHGGIETLLEITDIGSAGPTTPADLRVSPQAADAESDEGGEEHHAPGRWTAGDVSVKRGRPPAGALSDVTEDDDRAMRLRSRRKSGTKVLDYFWVLDAPEPGAPADSLSLELTTNRRLRARIRVHDPAGGWASVTRLKAPPDSSRTVPIPGAASYVEDDRVLVRFTTRSSRRIVHAIDLVRADTP